MRVLLLIASFPISSMGFIHSSSVRRLRPQSFSARSQTSLSMYINSDNPFEILGLNEATNDKEVIKRAYKRMALKYHPDVLATPQNSPEEKKAASDRFAKINWAYSQLSGKNEDNSTYKAKSTTRNASSTGGWTPPHRRSSGNRSFASSRSDSSQSADWSDFMPKSDESYDTGGDSFGKIFSDMFAGAASSAVSGAGGSTLFKDFIEFLEGTVDVFASTGSDDLELQYLLERGTRGEIRNELDDTKLVVDQLTTKLRGMEIETFSATAELSETEKYLEKIRLEEIIVEMNARKKVVKGYLQKAEQRLLKLQIRYREMKIRKSEWEEIKQESASSSDTSKRYSSSASQYSSPTKSDPDFFLKSKGSGSSSRTGRHGPSARANDSGRQPSWRNEGFGSSARRSSSRRPEAGNNSYNSSEPVPTDSSTSSSTGGSEESWRTEGFGSQRRSNSRQDKFAENQRPTETRSGQSDRDASGTSRSSGFSSVGSSSASTVPPHHRTTSSSTAQNDSKKRLREIIVDEEFEKLKRDLGLC